MNLELEIVTEKEGSPFRHIYPEILKYSNGRRYGKNFKRMREVVREFVDFLELGENITTLEVGAGHGQEPSKALRELGAEAYTLDADWNKYCTSLPTVDDLEKIGDECLYPSLVGRNHFLGDVAFIGHERSQLKERLYDLLFYWGSISGTGFCSSIEVSDSSREFGVDITLSKRLAAPINHITEGGYMSCISGFFNHTGDPRVYPDNIVAFGGEMVDILLIWLNDPLRKPKRAIVFGLSQDFAFDYVSKYAGGEFWAKTSTDKAIRDAVETHIIEKFLTNHWSLFSDYKKNDSSGYAKALKSLTSEQQDKISNLGIIDCITIQY